RVLREARSFRACPPVITASRCSLRDSPSASLRPIRKATRRSKFISGSRPDMKLWQLLPEAGRCRPIRTERLWKLSLAMRGTTRTPELTLSGEGGTFSTARGSAALAGAYGRFDYNVFGEQFNTSGQGVNDDYSSSAEGANVGVRLSPKAMFRLRARDSNERN